jgi:hypothetical protein
LLFKFVDKNAESGLIVHASAIKLFMQTK